MDVEQPFGLAAGDDDIDGGVVAGADALFARDDRAVRGLGAWHRHFHEGP
jgi:hypothetical protein